MSEVPFKDFLVFLYQSASSSSSSSTTRVSSSDLKNVVNDKKRVSSLAAGPSIPIKTINNDPKVIEEHEGLNRKISNKALSKSSIILHPRKGSFPATLSNGSTNHSVNTDHKRSSIEKIKLCPGDDLIKQRLGIGGKTNVHKNQSIIVINKQKSKNPSRDKQRLERGEIFQSETKKKMSIPASLSSDSISQGHPPKQFNEDETKGEVVEYTGDTSTSSLARSIKIAKSNSSSSYREELGDYPYLFTNANNPCSANGDGGSNSNNSDLQCDRNRLCVHDIHDLSFYKNFSASTRSKSSLGYIYSKSIINDNHHNYRYQQEVLCCLSKKLSRSTPMKLDLITTSSIGYPKDEDWEEGCSDDDEESVQDEQTIRDHHQDHLEHEQGTHSSSFRHNQQSKFLIDPEMPDIKNMKTSNITLLAPTALNLSKENNDPISTATTTNRKKGSSPILSDMQQREVSPRGINIDKSISSKLENTEGTLSTRQKWSSHHHEQLNPSSEPQQQGTRVTVTMDTTSLFLDTVYVNVKQELDRSATIKLFY